MTNHNSEEAASREAGSREHWIRRKLDLDIFEKILGARRHRDAQGYAHVLDGRRYPVLMVSMDKAEEWPWTAGSSVPMFSASLDLMAKIEEILTARGLSSLYVLELSERLYLHEGEITPERVFAFLTASPTDRAAAALLAWQRAQVEGLI